MKKISVWVLAIAAVIVSVSFDARAQSGQAASAASGNGAGASAPVSGRKSDRALRRQIYAALGKHKEIDAGNISVRAKGGAVTLTGTVTDNAQINSVADIAKGVPGVTSVTNKLTVSKPLGGM
ncbi:BON domain-containing protein [Paraburkholderia sp. MMS20-SJTR3]|uniref:BON domain-containing protein n=1 Tax=Paraburkholderia sejongensis TaxID=2886946 RepID=A0ABS8JYG3_9BURK|nr:BON domain-containing protein [Paraburkholderia sp. MMS20-SJTR3]MCC8394738.1 BON domain-containing protein [Paraburkholderia sp. MMS20-SJTR3]